MYSRDKKPKGFKSYKVVDIDGSTITDGGGILIEVSNQVALLVGKGSIPKVWAYKIAHIDGVLKLTPVVENSVSKDPSFAVKAEKGIFELVHVDPLLAEEVRVDDVIGYIHPNHGTSGGDVAVLRVVEKDDNTLSITALDYRPLGGDIRLIGGGVSIFGTIMRHFHIESENNAVLCSI